MDSQSTRHLGPDSCRWPGKDRKNYGCRVFGFVFGAFASSFSPFCARFDGLPMLGNSGIPWNNTDTQIYGWFSQNRPLLLRYLRMKPCLMSLCFLLDRCLMMTLTQTFFGNMEDPARTRIASASSPSWVVIREIWKEING